MEYGDFPFIDRKYLFCSQIPIIIYISIIREVRRMYEKETIIDKIGKVISVAGNAIMMNLLFLVSCIPVVTAGQAFCGLLSAIRYNIRGDKWFTGFKTGFKTRFWRGTIAWCAMLLIDYFMLRDVHYAFAQNLPVSQVAAWVMFALATMLTTSLLVLNVYIPTGIGTWIRNAVNMIFKVPLELLVSAALLWLPVVLCLLWFEIFYYGALIFIAVYFTLAVLGTTMLLKNALLQYLVDARAEGTLLAEEGKQKEEVEEDEEDE